MKCNIIKSTDIELNNKLQGLYHLSEGVHWERKIRKGDYKGLDEVCDVISNVGLNKRVYTYKENGIPFFSNSDLASNNPLERCKYVSKKYCYNEDAIIAPGMVLLTGVGTIGEVFYSTDDMVGAVVPRGNIIKISPNNRINSETLYTFLASSIGKALLIKYSSGTVQSYIDPTLIKNLPVPIFKETVQDNVKKLIVKAFQKRTLANSIIDKERERVQNEAGLGKLTRDDYEFYGPHHYNREVSTFVVNNLSSITLNAFNYSQKIKKLKESVYLKGSVSLGGILRDERGIFSSPILKRIELDSDKSVKLIGQRELFTCRKEGKKIARICAKKDAEIQYGEIIIAEVGTLGESETFCRCEFASNDLVGQCISEDFIRLRTKEEWHPGYVYAWLSSDYGFRLIRSTHSGTKLCRPIPKLLLELPVPELDVSVRNEIGEQIEQAFKLRYEALHIENEAISLIEKEIG